MAAACAGIRMMDDCRGRLAVERGRFDVIRAAVGACMTVLALVSGVEALGAGVGVTVVAHRGAMGERPENTLEAFRRAVETGADVVEVDVRLSADGVPFVLHDATLDRTTDGSGMASALGFEALRALDAGGWFGEEWAGLRIPSLADVLAWAKDETVVLLDLKERGGAFADAVAEVVKARGRAESVVVGVRTPEQAGEFRERLPESAQLGFIPSPDAIEAFAEAGVEVIRLWLRWLEAEPGLADRVKGTGRKLMINGTTGGVEETRRMLEFGPDWILIDDVPQLLGSLEVVGSVGSLRDEVPGSRR